MTKEQLKKIKQLPELKKKILEKAIIARFDRDWDYPIQFLMANSYFKEISEGRLSLNIDGMELCKDVNAELIEVVNDLIKRDLLKVTQLGCICPGSKFVKRYIDEVERDIGYDFIWPNTN